MGKLSGKIKNRATQAYADADARFDADEVAKRSQMAHNGEPMARVYQRIMSDPAIRQEETKQLGRYDLIYQSDNKEAVVGWIDHGKGMGEISQKAYDHLQDISTKGCYVVREKDTYAIKAYTDDIHGQYAVATEDAFTFSDTDKTVFDTYAEASAVSSSVAEQLGLLSSYESEEDDYLDDMPHSAEEGDGVMRGHEFDDMESSDDMQMGE